MSTVPMVMGACAGGYSECVAGVQAPDIGRNAPRVGAGFQQPIASTCNPNLPVSVPITPTTALSNAIARPSNPSMAEISNALGWDVGCGRVGMVGCAGQMLQICPYTVE
jgi:hypothetical protein